VKIEVHFRDEVLGTAEATGDGPVEYAGPNTPGVRHRVEFYEAQTELQGEALLRHVLARLQGQTWASESETAPAALANSEEQPADH
jgi:hypothetical protein